MGIQEKMVDVWLVSRGLGLAAVPKLRIVEVLIAEDIREGRDDERWLSVILELTSES